MSQWTDMELHAIVEADDLHIAPLREDGITCGTPTWIWCVAVDGGLYVRGYHGQRSRWYQAAIKQRAGQIVVGGETREVSFESAVEPLHDRIDAAYRAKYSASPYLAPMVAASARSASVRITPRGDSR